MSDVELRELPDGWAWTTLGEVAEYINGRAFKPSEWETEGLPIIRIQNLTQPHKPFNYSLKKVRDKYYVKNGDLLISWSATLGAFIWRRGPAVLNQHIFRVNENSNLIYKHYLFYAVQRYLSQLKSNVHGSGMQHITKGKFEAQSLPLAPLAEQRRIVAEIETLFTQLDAGVATLERAQRNLQRYKASVLKAACEGRLVPQEESDEPASELLQRILSERRAAWEAEQLAKMRAKGKEPKNDKWKAKYKEPAGPDIAELATLPAGWVWARLEQLIIKIKSGSSPKAEGRPAKPNEFGVLKVSALSWGQFLSHENKALLPGYDLGQNPTVQRDDLLISRANTVQLVGAVVLVERDYPNLMLSDKSLKLVPASDLVNLRFLLYALRFPMVRTYFEKVATGTSDSMRNLSQEKIMATLLPLPPLAEQRRIVSEVERHLSIIAQAETIIDTNLKRAARLRQSILKRAFSGKLVAQDSSDEPASALLARIEAEKLEAEKKTAKKRKTKKTRRKKT